MREIQPSDEDFFQYSVAQIEDRHIIEEELKEHFERFSEMDDDDD